MNRRIYKYPFPTVDVVELRLPIGARVLTVAEQHGETQLWADVDADARSELRTFRVIGTGHPVDRDDLPYADEYITTYQLLGGSLVFHVFEAIPTAKESN